MSFCNLLTETDHAQLGAAVQELYRSPSRRKCCSVYKFKEKGF